MPETSLENIKKATADLLGDGANLDHITDELIAEPAEELSIDDDSVEKTERDGRILYTAYGNNVYKDGKRVSFSQGYGTGEKYRCGRDRRKTVILSANGYDGVYYGGECSKGYSYYRIEFTAEA